MGLSKLFWAACWIALIIYCPLLVFKIVGVIIILAIVLD